MATGDEEDGGVDVSDSWEWPEEAYQDFVAERAAAFGILMMRIEMAKDDKLRDLGLAMLRQVIRSIKTPPGADILEVK